jgi:hypothetical protein
MWAVLYKMQFANTIVHQLVIFGAIDNLPDVTIGPGPNIIFYQGTLAVITISASGTPSLTVTNATSDTLILSVFDGLPAERYTIGGNSGFAQLSFSEWLTNRDSFSLLMSGENGDTVKLRLREDAGGFGEIVVNQEIVAEDPNSVDASETWHNLALQNGWTSSRQPGYRLYPDGTVGLRGLVQAGTIADGTIIANVPSPYRISQSGFFVGVCSNALNTCHLEILTNGNLVITRVVTAGALLSLDGMRYANTTI